MRRLSPRYGRNTESLLSMNNMDVCLNYDCIKETSKITHGIIHKHKYTYSTQSTLSLSLLGTHTHTDPKQSTLATSYTRQSCGNDGQGWPRGFWSFTCHTSSCLLRGTGVDRDQNHREEGGGSGGMEGGDERGTNTNTKLAVTTRVISAVRLELFVQCCFTSTETVRIIR